MTDDSFTQFASDQATHLNTTLIQIIYHNVVGPTNRWFGLHNPLWAVKLVQERKAWMKSDVSMSWKCKGRESKEIW